MSKQSVSVLLSGGGARGAYQAGVLWRMSESVGFSGKDWKIDDLAGISAGSINASFLTSVIHNPSELKRLGELWCGLTTSQVIRTDLYSLTKIGSSFVFDTAIGPIFRKTFAKALVDTDPLRQTLSTNLDTEKLKENICEEGIKSLVVAAYDYSQQRTVNFIQSSRNYQVRQNASRVMEPGEISVSTIMASCAIPIIFPPVLYNSRYFADGVVRNTSPLSPLIQLKSDKIFVVGVQKEREALDVGYTKKRRPPLATSLGLVLNALFFDNFDTDIERVEYINRSIGSAQDTPFKKIPLFVLRPSRSVVEVARETYKSLPRQIRYLMAGLGDSRETIEVASYLLFESEYTSRLVQLGYQDFKSQESKFLEFLARD